MTVASEKPLEPQDVAVLRTSHDHRAARPVFDHGCATHHHRVQYSVAELSLGQQQRPDLFRRNQQGLDWPQRTSVHERCLACELSHFPQHLAGPLDGKCLAGAGFELSKQFDIAS
jgi:hypothetical protein